ncbi:DUF6090 family protein [Cryomorphaceae bacterium 1068]|nr:DUF6090 family protein [Cryomorphaceae bacterium 1068]
MDSKFSKYLLYAIGEIVLVVIGILIALQINNWKETKKERAQEKAILSQVHTEFKSNLKQLDEKIDIRKRQITGAQDLLAFIDYPDSRVKDSIENALTYTIGYSTFDPIVNDLASAGSLRIIRNDSLKLLLSQWTSELVQVIESEQSWYKYRNEVYVPFLIENTQLRTLRNAAMNRTFVGKFLIDVDNREALDSRVDSIGNSAFSYDINVLLNNPDFEDHLTRCIVTNSISNVQSYILRKRILLILKILESELDLKN